MIRNICAGAGAILWFACATAAQPLTVSLDPTLFQSLALPTAASATTQGAQSPGPPPADSFAEVPLRITVGDTIAVVETSGREMRGRLVALSDVALTMAVAGTRQEVVATAIRRIDRRRPDSVRNGLLTGAGTGALLGFALGRSADSSSCPRSGRECGQGALIGTAGGAIWGAIGGWMTDALIRRREVIYLSPSGNWR